MNKTFSAAEKRSSSVCVCAWYYSNLGTYISFMFTLWGCVFLVRTMYFVKLGMQALEVRVSKG